MTTPAQRRIQSDTLAGYITYYSPTGRRFGLRTSDEREFTVHLASNAVSRIVRNLGDDYRDTTADTVDMLAEGRFVFAYGILYEWEGGSRFDAKEITFPEETRGQYVFEHPNWWVQQATAIADFYLRGQFPDGVYDWRNFRTHLTLSGTHLPDFAGGDVRQETDTISRLVYGLSTAYLLTGKDRFLEAAEAGTLYLREHMRVDDQADGITYWYHGIDITSSGIARSLRLGVRRRLRRDPDVRADLRARRPHPDVTASPATRGSWRTSTGRPPCSRSTSATPCAAGSSRTSTRSPWTRTPTRSAATGPARTGTRSATTPRRT
jgi:hypothetical protein